MLCACTMVACVLLSVAVYVACPILKVNFNECDLAAVIRAMLTLDAGGRSNQRGLTVVVNSTIKSWTTVISMS